MKMKGKLEQYIKDILISKENRIRLYLLAFLLPINLSNCTTMEPEFKIFGDAEILQDIKINE